MVVGRWVVLGVLSLAWACMQDHPTAPTPRAFTGTGARFAISDAARRGDVGFYWRAPFVANAPYGGTFDSAVTNVEVKICAVTGSDCSADVASFSRASKPAVAVDSAAQTYGVVWHTRTSPVAAAQSYRVRVVVGSLVLGSADVQVVGSERELKAVPAGYVGVVAGRPVPINFRIETGIVGAIRLCDTSVTITEGGAHAFEATLLDLHGKVMDTTAVAWLGGDSVAAVSSPARGRATAYGRVAGVTTISAASQRVTASARLTVERAGATFVTGLLHTCGLGRDGHVYCWGDNLDGELGSGATQSTGVPDARRVAGDTTHVVQVAAGATQSCALNEMGALSCWGTSVPGTEDVVVQPMPTRVPSAMHFRQVSAGASHRCALTDDGTAYCWGSNESGQLGDGTTIAHESPTLVAGGLHFSRIEAGYFSTCALSLDGRVYCWGHNCAGELGDGTTTAHAVPLPIASELRFTKLSMQWSHGCALTATGEAYCWGPNWSGQLGIAGDAPLSAVPVAAAPAQRFVTISAGQGSTCALTSTGAAYCWGANESGQLGDGTTVDRASPVAVAGNLQFVRVAIGGAHACGVTASGGAYCWGNNAYGQLGDGTMATRLMPVRVLGGMLFR